MKSSLIVSYIICAIVMIREFRPIEPFIAPFLMSPPLNYSDKYINENIYPVGTYSATIFSIFMFLVTDYLRYKPVVILDGIAGIFSYVLFLGIPTKTMLTCEQIFFGFFYSSDVACNTYLYAIVRDPADYLKITGYVKTCSLIGRFFNGVFSQFIQTFLEQHAFNILLYACISGMIVVTILSSILPGVKYSTYFHKANEENCSNSYKREGKVKLEDVHTTAEITPVENNVPTERISHVFKHLYNDFRMAYSNFYVLKWSLWVSFSLAGWYFVVTYSQLLWQEIVEKSKEKNEQLMLMNGAVESISTLTSALSAYSFSRTNIKWKEHITLVIALSTIALSALVFCSFMSSSLFIIYITYILYNAVFHTMIMIAQSEIAKHIEQDSYGLIFGFNNFIALTLQSIITFCLIQGHIMRFTNREQFLFYSIWYIIMACPAIIVLVTKPIMKELKQISKNNPSSIEVIGR